MQVNNGLNFGWQESMFTRVAGLNTGLSSHLGDQSRKPARSTFLAESMSRSNPEIGSVPISTREPSGLHGSVSNRAIDAAVIRRPPLTIFLFVCSANHAEITGNRLRSLQIFSVYQSVQRYQLLSMGLNTSFLRFFSR